jgi:hypothetical protein
MRVASLRVEPDPFSASFVSNIVVEDSLDIRGARVSLNGGELAFEGELIEDAGTIFEASFSEGSLVARTHGPMRLRATLEGPGLRAAGAGTVLLYEGTLTAGNEGGLFAVDGGKLFVEPAATLTAQFTPRRFFIGGDLQGTVEFADGFQLIKRFGDDREPNIGIGKLHLTGGSTWVTNASGNLPNIDPAAMRNEADYFGLIALAWPGSTWQVASRAQSFNQHVEVLTSTSLVTDADLTLAPESMFSFGAHNFELANGPVRLSSSNGALVKRGAADLRVHGRLNTINANVIDVRQGRLVMNNRTAEGTGTLDVNVHDGGTLSGGNAAAATGLIPGMIRVEAGGKLDPGDGTATGILSIVGDFAGLELKPASAYVPTIAGATAGALHDQMRVAGEVELGDGIGEHAVLAPSLSYAPQPGDLIFLIDNDGADPILGLFKTPGGAALTEGSFFDLTSSDGLAYRFEIGYRGDATGGFFSSPSGNDFVLRAVAIPEPASIVLLVACGGIVALIRGLLRGPQSRPTER